IRQTCERWGMVVQTAETLQQMLDFLERGDGRTRFDVIMIDDDMRGMYGKTSHDFIATETVFLRVPTILLTAYAHQDAPQHPAIKSYVDKPVRTALLHKALLAAIPAMQ